MKRFAEYLPLAVVIVAAFALRRVNVNQYYLVIVIVVLSGGVPWLVARIRERMLVAQRGRELGDPFLAEMLLDDRLVGRITERQVIEMVWRRYRIEAVSEEARSIIYDDQLWDDCRFVFRDPKTSMTCLQYLAGGPAPYIRDGHITLRDLYFKQHEKQVRAIRVMDASSS